MKREARSCLPPHSDMATVLSKHRFDRRIESRHGRRAIWIATAKSTSSINDQPPDDRRTLTIIAGSGDGTVAHAFTIATQAGPFTFALAADIDGNGTRDIVAGQEPDLVNVYPGNGDLTFGSPVLLASGAGPRDAITGDFNGDGLRDITVANGDGESVSIFVNGGTLLFTRRDIAFDRQINDVTTRDLDGDDILDLVLAGASRDHNVFAEGRVYVLTGNGDGSFNPPTAYATARGAFRIVAGDFDHDGRLDIATGNRSAIRSTCGGDRLTYWDTVSILSGRSDGTFADPVDFSLSSTFEPFDPTFINTLTSLNTSDVDGDGFPDLIASGGAVLVSLDPRANEAPSPLAETVFADGPVANAIGRATDPNFHALSFTWTDDEGRIVGTEPSPCVAVPSGHGIFTLTVDDGHGGTASTTVASFLPTENVLEIVRPNDFDTETVLEPGVPYEIRWRRWPGLYSSFDVLVRDVSEDESAPLMLVPGCQDVAGSANGCVWLDPGPVSSTLRQFVVRGHRNDGVRDAIDGSAPFEVRGTHTGSLPDEWTSEDIGDTRLAGSARFGGDVFTIEGSGADIWGTADAFRWIHQPVTGSFEIVVRVASVQNVDRWVKAGLMIRASGTDPSAAHASLFATPGKGVAFQRRRAQGDASVHTAGPAIASPVWLRLVRSGSRVVAYYRRDTADAWTRIGSDTIALGESVEVGLAVSSHVSTSLATAVFDNLRIDR
jgi:hypothetical protein